MIAGEQERLFEAEEEVKREREGSEQNIRYRKAKG